MSAARDLKPAPKLRGDLTGMAEALAQFAREQRPQTETETRSRGSRCWCRASTRRPRSRRWSRISQQPAVGRKSSSTTIIHRISDQSDRG